MFFTLRTFLPSFLPSLSPSPSFSYRDSWKLKFSRVSLLSRRGEKVDKVSRLSAKLPSLGQLGTACTKPAKISNTNYKITLLEGGIEEGKKGKKCSRCNARWFVRPTCCTSSTEGNWTKCTRSKLGTRSHRRQLVGQKFAIVLSIVYGSNRWNDGRKWLNTRGY